MLKIFWLVVAFFMILVSKAQVKADLLPQTVVQKLAIKVPTEQLPTFDLQKVINEEIKNRKDKTGRYMFGYEHITAYSLSNSGVWTVLENGDKIWMLKLKSEQALSINIVFDDFYLPKGATLHVYNPTKTTINGAYTSANNNVQNVLGTDLVKGDEMIVEYYEPKSVAGKGRLLIGMVVHGFEDINGWYKNQLKVNESGACNMDVICADTNVWGNEIRSVARVLNGGGLCSGTLVNNTLRDGTPYFLTANHCNPQSMGSAVFRFNYNSPICGSQIVSDSQTATTNDIINGSSFKARNPNSDFGLIELNSIPPSNYRVYYAGWNNSGDIPNSTVGIHHPSGDVKKISFDDDSPVSGNMSTAATNAEWRILAWDRNTTTEGGSSGSGLWDENHLLVGQLHGGQATCSNSINDYYGKIAVSWNGNSATSRLKDWLDPNNSGVATLKGYDPNASTNDVSLIGMVSPKEVNCGTMLYPVFMLKNVGEDTLLTVDFIYGVNNVLSSFYTWNGVVNPDGITAIQLPPVNVTNINELSLRIEASMPNGVADGDTSNNVLVTTIVNNQKCLAYPNPFSNELIVNFEQEKIEESPVQVILLDAQGKEVKNYTFDGTTTSIIDTRDLAKGIYLLRIQYRKTETTQKLVK